MPGSLRKFKQEALNRPRVQRAYAELADEFSFLEAILSARAESGLTQAEVAARTGTTQSAIARLESPQGRHSPSIATLQRYAKALGYTLEIRLVRQRSRVGRAGTS